MVIFGKPFGTWNFTKKIELIQDSSTTDQLINDLCTLLIILEKHGMLFPKKIALHGDVKNTRNSKFEYDIQNYIVLDEDDYNKCDYWYHLFYQFNHVEKKLPYSIDINGSTLLLENGNNFFVEDGFYATVYIDENEIFFILKTYATDWLPYRADLRGGINPDYEVNAVRLENALVELTKTFTDYEVEQVVTEIEAYDPNRLFRLVNQRYAEFEGVEEIVLYDPSGRMMGSYNPVTGEVE